MGWDCIKYKGHFELFNDFDLWTLRHFFIQEAQNLEAEQASSEATLAREFFEKWQWHGPGVFTGTDFSVFVADGESRWELLMQLLQKAGDRISRFGESIPADYLKLHLNAHGVYFNQPLPVRPYLICIGRICTLLDKHKPPF